MSSDLPTSKVARAAKLAGAGLRVGANYVKHAVRQATGAETAAAGNVIRDEANAAALFDTFSELRGGALKFAQVLSMDRTGLLPRAYADRFAMAQHQAPPLSGPLVVKTFRAATGKSPGEVFDEFDLTARAAASIGQVHHARLGGKELAVKVQYPGVATSIQSDLNLIKPVAFRVLGLSAADFREYLAEVEGKLLEETD
ncbi:MAG: AarF/ABC1/UbiB kinase family protein, partial [Hymenobacteraceae bacterium]|nr:AarF/ABC1/UbiB kinase family protein [Hymenobacteraceae bacterium]